MSIKEKLEADVKQAMLARDKTLTTTLRGLKSVILYAEVATGNRDKGLSDPAIVNLFTKEVKKRQESAEMYNQGGNSERAAAELAEKRIIEQYLPPQLNDEELTKLVDEAIKSVRLLSPQNMGQIIGWVKQNSQGNVEGSRIAATVKDRLKAIS